MIWSVPIFRHEIPAQAGHAGEYLFTDGATASWQVVTSQAQNDAYCEVSFGEGSGEEENFNFSSDFTTVNFSTLLNYQLNDIGGNYNPTTNFYRVPYSGRYKITCKLRLIDNSHRNSYGIGAGSDNTDSPSFMWLENQDAQSRNGALNVIVAHFEQGDFIRMLAYCDNGAAASDGNMVIELLAADLTPIVAGGKPYHTYVTQTVKLGSELAFNNGLYYLKTRYPLAIGEDMKNKFVKVYKGNSMLIYGEDWLFNSLPGATMGSIPSFLTDGVGLQFEPAAEELYTLEYTERSIDFTPRMMKRNGHNTDVPIHSSAIRRKIYNYPLQSNELVTNIIQNDESYYTITTATTTHDWYYASEVAVTNWAWGEAFYFNIGEGSNEMQLKLRLECYKRGGNPNISGGRMNCLDVPLCIVGLNKVDILADLQKGNSKNESMYRFRLRDITNNIVTNFSPDVLQVKHCGLYDVLTDTTLGRYIRVCFK